MPSSDVVGCQSIGRMRSSNWEDVRNFHFLMIVHRMAIPPTDAAMTTSTSTVARVILDDDPEVAAAAVGEALDAACVVTVTWALVGVATTGDSGAAVVDGRGGLDEGKLGDDNDEDVLEEEELELTLELEAACVELGRSLGKGVLVEDDDEVEVAGVLEVAGVFFEEVAVSDEEVVDCVVELDADAVLDELDGGSAATPLAGLLLSLPLPGRSRAACGEGARFFISRLRLT
jgi:hypothetical protein